MSKVRQRCTTLARRGAEKIQRWRVIFTVMYNAVYNALILLAQQAIIFPSKGLWPVYGMNLASQVTLSLWNCTCMLVAIACNCKLCTWFAEKRFLSGEAKHASSHCLGYWQTWISILRTWKCSRPSGGIKYRWAWAIKLTANNVSMCQKLGKCLLFCKCLDACKQTLSVQKCSKPSDGIERPA